MIRLKTLEEIYEVHVNRIALYKARQEPVLVVFSAIPGSGKSELSKRLARDYDLLRIANKDIRAAIAATGHERDADISEYRLWLLDKLIGKQTPSIVFDHNIDQWYEPSKQWAERNNYQYILVRIDVPRETLEKRLLRREGTHRAKAFKVLDAYETEHKRLAAKMEATLTLEGDYDLDAAARQIAEL